MMHDYNIIDQEPHFIIDATTRKITNELASEIAIVQFDHNSEVFTFELPRYIEAHDMTECNRVEVHYKNTDASTSAEVLGVYEVDDLQPDPEDENKAVCTWLISQNATQKVGKLDFLVRFSRVAEDGTILYAWNTSIFTGIMVSAGLMNSEEIVEQYADVLEQWKIELFDASAEGVENINTAKAQALADIEAVSSNVATFSNALKGTASGQSVTLTDVSPIEHNISVKVKTKNVAFNATYNDVSVGNTQTGVVVAYAKTLEKGKTYTLSFDTENTGATMQFVSYGKPVTMLTSQYFVADGTRKSVTFTMTDDYYKSFSITWVQLRSNSTANSGSCSNLMIEEGKVATTYAEYVSDLKDVNLNDRYYSLEDGTYGDIVSTYPDMSFTMLDARANGLIIEATYNRDINKAFAEFESLKNAVISLGGNV